MLESWPEGKERRRIWCSPQDAHDLLRHPWMKTALATWAKKEVRWAGCCCGFAWRVGAVENERSCGPRSDH